MTNISNTEAIVMRRVHLIRILKLVISTAVLMVLTFTAALWGIGREVWVARVFQNAPADPGSLVSFYFTAFLHTRLIVQALVVMTLASLIFLVRELLALGRFE